MQALTKTCRCINVHYIAITKQERAQNPHVGFIHKNQHPTFTVINTIQRIFLEKDAKCIVKMLKGASRRIISRWKKKFCELNF